jgi:hypothetical protein
MSVALSRPAARSHDPFVGARDKRVQSPNKNAPLAAEGLRVDRRRLLTPY